MAEQKLRTAEILFRCAQQMDLMPVWITPLGTFAITVDGRERYVNWTRSLLNSDSSAALAKNKYVTRLILGRHGMQNIPFTQSRTHAEAETFLGRHGTIVAKPTTGSGAKDIHIITHFAELRALKIDQYILEKYIAGKELRYLLLNGRIIAVHRSDYGTSVAEDRPLRRISYHSASWDQTLLTSSLRIADILNLKFAAVDFLIDTSGRAYILEVNTMPGLKWFHAPSSGPVVDVARLFLESIVSNERSERTLTPGLIAPGFAKAYS